MIEDNIEKLARDVLSAARARGVRIATAESCTGGLISSALTAVSGSSDVFDRGFVTYSNEAKRQMLDVSDTSLTKFGAVSENVAKEMSYGAMTNSMAEITVAVTGIAGPEGGTKDKPVGLVWFGVCEQGMAPDGVKQVFSGHDRNGIRSEAVNYALHLLLDRLS